MIKSLFETTLTDVKKTDVEGIGNLRYEPDGCVYRWVKSTCEVAVVAHQPLCYDDALGIASQTGIVTMVLEPGSDACDLTLFAGISMAAWSAPTTTDPQYAWIQIYGFHANAEVEVESSTNCVIGDSMTMQTGTGTTTAALIRSTAVGSSPLYSAHAIMLEALSSTDVQPLNVFVKAL